MTVTAMYAPMFSTSMLHIFEGAISLSPTDNRIYIRTSPTIAERTAREYQYLEVPEHDFPMNIRIRTKFGFPLCLRAVDGLKYRSGFLEISPNEIGRGGRAAWSGANLALNLPYSCTCDFSS